MPVRLFAYPSGQPGDYDAETVDAVARAGYSHAFTTRAGWNRPATPALEGHRVVVEPQRTFSSLAARRVVARSRRKVQLLGPSRLYKYAITFRLGSRFWSVEGMSAPGSLHAAHAGRDPASSGPARRRTASANTFNSSTARALQMSTR